MFFLSGLHVKTVLYHVKFPTTPPRSKVGDFIHRHFESWTWVTVALNCHQPTNVFHNLQGRQISHVYFFQAPEVRRLVCFHNCLHTGQSSQQQTSLLTSIAWKYGGCPSLSIILYMRPKLMFMTTLLYMSIQQSACDFILIVCDILAMVQHSTAMQGI